MYMIFDELSYNNASDNALTLPVSIAVNKQILEVFLMLDNDAILVAYQINPIIILTHVTVHSAISIRACAL